MPENTAERDLEVKRWLEQIGPELAGADASWAAGNAGRGRVGARRAAGMGLKAWLAVEPRAEYGTNFMHHLNALADDPRSPDAVREAAWRLAARPIPEGGFKVETAPALTPMVDARGIIAWAEAERGRLTGTTAPPPD